MMNKKRTQKKITADILAYFKENEEVFNTILEELDDYNGYLRDDRWLDMYMLPEVVDSTDPVRLLNMAYFGNDLDNWHYNSDHKQVYDSFNPNREYFRFNVYGNFESTNWKKYREYLDEYCIEVMAEYRENIDTINNDEVLSALFDALEKAE